MSSFQIGMSRDVGEGRKKGRGRQMGLWSVPGEDRDVEKEKGGSREMREMRG